MQEMLQLLNQISDELNKDLNLDSMLQRVIDLTVTHFGATNGSIMLFDEDKRVSRYILQQQDISEATAYKIVGQVLTEGFAGWVLRHRRGDIITDTRKDGRWLTYDNQPYTVRSVLATPLIRRNHILGILTINHDSEPNYFKTEDLALLNAIAGQAAIALENAQLFRQKEQERATLLAIINSSRDVIIVTYDDDNKVLLLNPAAEKTLRAKPGQWLNRPLKDVTSFKKIVALVESDDVSNFGLQLPDGHSLWANVVSVPNVGKLTLMYDVTALKALDKVKTEFITTFTHDLSAPLAAVKGYLELMHIDGKLTDQQEEDLDAIRMAVHQMSTLIKDLLDLTRLESLNDFFTCNIPLEEMVERSYTTFQPIAAAKKIKLSLRTDGPHLVMQGNPTLISRAIDNLVENAIKYTYPNGEIALSLTQYDTEARISVQDTGVGIAAGDIGMVFNKFFRAHAPIEDGIPGSGLGLSIVKTIVERHGGKIWVDSEINVGSTFTIALPLAADGVAS